MLRLNLDVGGARSRRKPVSLLQGEMQGRSFRKAQRQQVAMRGGASRPLKLGSVMGAVLGLDMWRTPEQDMNIVTSDANFARSQKRRVDRAAVVIY